LLLVRLDNELFFTFPSLCVWKAPEGFRKKACLKLLYGEDPSVTNLIRSTLQVEDAPVTAVVDDLTHCYPSDSYLNESLRYVAVELRSQQGRDALIYVQLAFILWSFVIK
jgi:hypothetical protein